VLLTLVNAATSLHKGVKAGPDPWGGSTLEWFAPSPPPIHNFDLVPDVRSEEPLADIREAVRRRQTRWNPPPARPADAPEETPEPAPAAVQADQEGESSEAEDDRPVA